MTQLGHGMNGHVKPNIDQLINLPGLDNDYSDDYLKGGGGIGTGGVLKPGGGNTSPGSGFGSLKATSKI